MSDKVSQKQLIKCKRQIENGDGYDQIKNKEMNKMNTKKLFLSMIVVCLIFPLSACNGKQNEGNAIVTETAVTEIPAEATAESTAETVVEIPENEVQLAATVVSEENAPLQTTDEVLATAEIHSETGNVADAVVPVPEDENEKQKEEEKMKLAIGEKVVKVKWEAVYRY